MASKEIITVRPAERKDLDVIVNLTLRLKKLNEEFDPLYTVKPNAEEEAKDYISKSFDDENVIMLVAEADGKVVGFVRALIKTRMFYQPDVEGVISDLYVLPAYRRKGVGDKLLDEVAKLLKARGVKILAAEFPPYNTIAVSFYEKRGFKPLLNTFFKEI